MTKRGQEAPHFDYAAEPESDQLRIEMEQPPQADEQAIEASTSEESTPAPLEQERVIDSRIPSEVRDRISRDFEEVDKEWERRDKNHPFTMAKNRQDVGGIMLTGSDIERKEKPAAKPASRPKKDRRHLSSRRKMAADDTPESVRERTAHLGPSEELTEEERESGRRALEAAKRQLGLK